jgi:hypothetical protein
LIGGPLRIKIFMNPPRKIFPLTLGWVCLGVVGLLGLAGVILWRAQPGGAPTPKISEIKAKAGQGDAQAQASLGDLYYYGQGLAKNHAEAVKWWRKAAEQGDPKSQFSMAFCYFQGLGVERDVAQAMKWYQSTTNQGYNISGVAAKLNSVLELNSTTPRTGQPGGVPGSLRP